MASSSLQAPLLRGNDVEEGATPPTKEELDEELKKGTMSWMDLIQLFMNPQHWMVTTIVALAFVCVLCFVSYEGDKITDGKPPNVTSPMIQTAIVCLGALLASAYSAFLGVQLAEEVNKFRGLNSKLAANRDRLSTSCAKLKEQVDDMQDQVEKFETLKDSMASFSDKADSDFQQIFEKATGVLDRMTNLVQEDVGAILSNVAMHIEMSDDTEGMSEEEYNTFAKRLPRSFEAPDFMTVSKGKEVATFEDVQVVIDNAKAQVVPPPTATATGNSARANSSC
mmetsp:Transcript_66122/g.184130  ORF Transcript_66122/g.184130 Transcript_66122/m.184130 type:complete len:281 (+) Transcript_66122:103-945(+)